MKAKVSQYLNELVSLTVLVLMVLALATGPSPWSPVAAEPVADRQSAPLVINVRAPAVVERPGVRAGQVVLSSDTAERRGAEAR